MLDDYSETIDKVSTKIFSRFSDMAGRNMTVDDFIGVVQKLQSEGENSLTVEDVKRIFSVYDTSKDSLLQLEEFNFAFSEIYLRSYNYKKSRGQAFLQTQTKGWVTTLALLSLW